MILMPVWVFEETDGGYRAILGSEPRKNAEREWIPRDVVESCIYSPGHSEGVSPRFALMMLREIPEDIKKKNPNIYGS